MLHNLLGWDTVQICLWNFVKRTFSALDMNSVQILSVMWYLNMLFGWVENIFILSDMHAQSSFPFSLAFELHVVYVLYSSPWRSSISPFLPPAHSSLECSVSWWDPGRPGRVLAVCAVVVTHHRTTLEYIVIRGYCLFLQYLSPILYFKRQTTKSIQIALLF